MSAHEHNEVEIEPVPGLPEELPDGETILWQGRPEWRALARETFKIRAIAIYLLIFVGLRAFAAIRAAEGAVGFLHVLLTCAIAGACVGGIAFVARLYASSTVYTITTKRVVMRIGVAIPITWNIPFKRIASADVLVRSDGDGDITLQLAAPNRIAWLHLWPHVQPWHYVKARPAFRAIHDPKGVAAILGNAVDAWTSPLPARPRDVAAPIRIESTPALTARAAH